MSKTETITLSDDDEVLENRMLRQLPQISANEDVQQQQQPHQQQQQQQENEHPMMMMVLQTLLQMQQTNQQMQQAQQRMNQQLLQIQQQNDHRFVAQDVRLELLENGGGRDGPVRYLRAIPDPGPAIANTGVAPDAGLRHRARYAPDEDLRIVQYLVERNKIDRAKADGVWQEMRNDDPILARRSVPSLKHRFRVYIWPELMAGNNRRWQQYNENPQIMQKFSRIWPGRFQAP